MFFRVALYFLNKITRLHLVLRRGPASCFFHKFISNRALPDPPYIPKESLQQATMPLSQTKSFALLRHTTVHKGGTLTIEHTPITSSSQKPVKKIYPNKKIRKPFTYHHVPGHNTNGKMHLATYRSIYSHHAQCFLCFCSNQSHAKEQRKTHWDTTSHRHVFCLSTRNLPHCHNQCKRFSRTRLNGVVHRGLLHNKHCTRGEAQAKHRQGTISMSNAWT